MTSFHVMGGSTAHVRNCMSPFSHFHAPTRNPVAMSHTRQVPSHPASGSRSLLTPHPTPITPKFNLIRPTPRAPPIASVQSTVAATVVEPAAAYFNMSTTPVSSLLCFIPNPVVRSWTQAAVDVALPLLIGLLVVEVMNRMASQAKKVRDVSNVQTSGSAYIWSWVPIALAPPLSLFVPLVASLMSMENLARTVDRAHHCNHLDVPPWLDLLTHSLAHWLDRISDRLIDVASIGCIIFITWVFIQWKQLKISRWLQEKENPDLDKVVIPVAAVLDWVLCAATVLVCCQILGVDLRPWLAVGGVSSLVVGFSAQALLANAISGLSIFLSRPFLPGERITVVGSSNLIVSGTVMQVEPVRTVIQTDDGVPVRIPNKMIADFVIYNESRASDGLVDSTWRGQTLLSRRLLRTHVKMPPSNADGVTEMMLKLEQYLQSSNSVDILRGMSVALEGINEKGYDIMVRCCLLSATVAEQKRSASDIFLGISRIAAEYNAIATTRPGVMDK